MKKITSFLSFILTFTFSNVEYNHPELNWHSFETKHFKIHFHDETENTAREAATVAEIIYPKITDFYKFYPKEKTHLILIDPDEGLSINDSKFSKVDFPDPDWPTKPTISPGIIFRLTPFKTSRTSFPC